MADVYGSQEQFDDPVDKVKDNIDDLITAMASDSPRIAYCYKGHNTVPVLLSGATVDFEGTNPILTGKATGDVYDYRVIISVRIHVDYAGGYCDGEKVARLLNSVDNYLNTHRNLGDGYRIIEVTGHKSFLDFAESGTIGGELKVEVDYVLEHIQT